MKLKIGISGMGSIHALGHARDSIWENYLIPKTFLTHFDGKLLEDSSNLLKELSTKSKNYKSLDPSVLLAMLASETAIREAKWDSNFGVTIGSSRGATTNLEKHLNYFFEQGKTSPLSSPTTTLGNISSWVGQYLQSEGLRSEHSMTCSTAFHSILNAIAWIKSGICTKVIAGGTESPLTPFTKAQMNALKITAKKQEAFPCKALDLEKKYNTMCLGEGAAVFCLEENPKTSPLANIIGIGFGSEDLTHGTSISKDGMAFQKSMRKALEGFSETIDCIVTHTPGTIKGDAGELAAIHQIFPNEKPLLTCNKWKLGHTLGASGGISLEMAVLMLLNNEFIPVPYLEHSKTPGKLKTILINTLGFGGNAVSLVVQRT